MVLRRLESITGNLVLTTVLKTKIGHRRVKRLTFRALALRQSDSIGTSESANKRTIQRYATCQAPLLA